MQSMVSFTNMTMLLFVFVLVTLSNEVCGSAFETDRIDEDISVTQNFIMLTSSTSVTEPNPTQRNDELSEEVIVEVRDYYLKIMDGFGARLPFRDQIQLLTKKFLPSQQMLEEALTKEMEQLKSTNTTNVDINHTCLFNEPITFRYRTFDGVLKTVNITQSSVLSFGRHEKNDIVMSLGTDTYVSRIHGFIMFAFNKIIVFDGPWNLSGTKTVTRSDYPNNLVNSLPKNHGKRSLLIFEQTAIFLLEVGLRRPNTCNLWIQPLEFNQNDECLESSPQNVQDDEEEDDPIFNVQDLFRND